MQANKTQSIYSIAAQLEAIKQKVTTGKVSNVYAANGKIKQLQIKLQQAKWNEFLSR